MAEAKSGGKSQKGPKFATLSNSTPDFQNGGWSGLPTLPPYNYLLALVSGPVNVFDNDSHARLSLDLSKPQKEQFVIFVLERYIECSIKY